MQFPNINAPTGPTGPTGPILSSYMEALGNTQTVAAGGNIAFDLDTYESIGDNIEIDPTGTIFTIHQTGLYQVEWNINVSPGSAPAVVGVVEDGEMLSGAASSTGGNLASGSLIYVDTVPFTLTLHNYYDTVDLEHPLQWDNSAASIRIIKFADGPSVP